MPNDSCLYLYDDTSLSFLKKWKAEARRLIREEMGLQMPKTRVLHRGLWHPFQMVIFEHPRQLGHFDPHGNRIGLNKNLMWQAKDEVIRQILRHELAHFYCHMEYGQQNIDPHGVDFRRTCKAFGWGEEVFKAQTSVEKQNESVEGDLASDRLLSKLKKLLALGESSNPHEAELATMKANQLLLKHNLQHLEHFKENLQDSTKDDQTCMKVVLRAKRNSQKYHAIYQILEHFFVQPVFNYASGEVRLEIIGRRVNVQLAEYVALYLEREFERLWEQVKKEKPKLKGKRGKNSFFKGLAAGFSEKMKNSQEEVKKQRASSGQNAGKELLILRRDLERQVKQVYGRLGSRTTAQSKGDARSEQVGREKGRNLNIHSPLNGQKSQRPKLLGRR